MRYAIPALAFLFGYVIGEAKYYITDYWEALSGFLDRRDEVVIERLKRGR